MRTWCDAQLMIKKSWTVSNVLVSMWDLDNKELAMNSSVAISLMSIKQEFKTVDINCALIVPLARFLTYFPFFYLGSFYSQKRANFQIISVQNGFETCKNIGI